MDGYRTAGYFFVWLRDNKDPEFLRKFNRSTLEVIPWSFDGAIKHIQLCSEILQSDGEPLPDHRERSWKEKQKPELLDERRI